MGKMTIIQRTITILIGAQLIASAVILIIFDLNAYDHFLGDFSWIRYIKELNGTIPFFADGRPVLFASRFLLPCEKKEAHFCTWQRKLIKII